MTTMAAGSRTDFFAPSYSSARRDLSMYAPASDDPAVTTTLAPPASGSESTAPPSAAAVAAAASYRPVAPLASSALIKVYRQLSKAQLTFLVTLTSMAGYSLCPLALSQSSSVTTLLALTAGTALCSASANSINQLVEAPYDAQMARTRNRPLPARLLSPLHAASFALATGLSGVGILAALTNGPTALLGLANIGLYAFVYTPMKRLSIANTWLGAVVGALPPLMGWTAATGGEHLLDVAPLALAFLVYAWQFPHFNSLSQSLSAEYARGGYRMMSVTNPSLNRRTALRYAWAMVPVCSVVLPFMTPVVHWSYALLSLAPNAAMVWASHRFWRGKTDRDARACFFASLVHLPAVLLLAMACKTDVVQGLLSLVNGQPDEPEDTAGQVEA